MIVDNHCMTFGKNGSLVVDYLTKALEPKFTDASGKKYLANTSIVLKKIFASGTK